MRLASTRPWLFMLVLYKIPQVVPKYPRATSAKNKKFCTRNVFLGLCDVTFPYKNLVKIRKANLFPHAIQKPFFSAASTALFLKAGVMGVVLAVSFMAIQGQPSHRAADVTAIPQRTQLAVRV
jgi:hypothetical protein